MVLYSSLRFFDPAILVAPEEIAESAVAELRDLIKHSRREASGRNGEFAFLARHDLGLERSRLSRWWQRRRTSARVKHWVSSLPSPEQEASNGGTRAIGRRRRTCSTVYSCC